MFELLSTVLELTRNTLVSFCRMQVSFSSIRQRLKCYLMLNMTIPITCFGLGQRCRGLRISVWILTETSLRRTNWQMRQEVVTSSGYLSQQHLQPMGAE